MTELNLQTAAPAPLSDAIAANLNGTVHAVPGHVPVLVTHDKTGLHSLERFAESPMQASAKVSLHGLPSFSAYVNRFKNEDTVIFVSPNLRSLDGRSPIACACIDYHGREVARFVQHRATLIAAPHLAYAKLMAIDDAGFIEQQDLAKALQGLERFVTSMPGAELSEIARTLQLTSKGEFANVQDDFTGSVDFRFNMKVAASAGVELRQLTVPEVVTFTLPLLEGTQPIEVQCRFKYRVPEQAGGRPLLALEIIDRDWLEKECIDFVASTLSGLTESPVYIGDSTGLNERK